MPKAEYTYALDTDGVLYACFGRTVKFILNSGEWEEVTNPKEYDSLFSYFSPTKIISVEDAMKISNNLEPMDYFNVNKRVYLTETEINEELCQIMQGRKYREKIEKLVINSDISTKVLVLEWLIKNPSLHELTIEMLVRNI